MNRNYKFVDSIYLSFAGRAFDLHNDFNFKGLSYSVSERTLVLRWERSTGDRVPADTPEGLFIEFSGVSEFRFMPRDSEMPFSEDDCLSDLGYWVDEDWAEGIVTLGGDQQAEPHWLTAFNFMSGATIAVQAESSHAAEAA